MNSTTMKLTGPYHDFWLLNEKVHPFTSYTEYLGRKDAHGRIEDDLLQYFNDYLQWIPTRSPNGRETRGLDYYGPTIITQNGLEIFIEIFSHLKQIYLSAPQEFVITGFYSFQLDENERPIDNGEYEKYKITKKYICNTLGKLSELGKAARNNSSYILHLGL